MENFTFPEIQNLWTADAGKGIPLGSKVKVEPSSTDRAIVALGATGLPIGLPNIAGASAYAMIYANSGPLYLVKVANTSGSDILQGETVRPVTTAGDPYLVEQGGADNPGMIVGVAFTRIPTGKTGWVVYEGVCKALAAGNITTERAIIPAASGRVTHAAAVTGAHMGHPAEDCSASSAGDLIKVRVRLS